MFFIERRGWTSLDEAREPQGDRASRAVLKNIEGGGAPRGAGDCVWEFGTFCQSLGQYAKAIEHHELCLKIEKEGGGGSRGEEGCIREFGELIHQPWSVHKGDRELRGVLNSRDGCGGPRGAGGYLGEFGELLQRPRSVHKGDRE